MELNKSCKEAFETAVARGSVQFAGSSDADILNGLKHCAGEVIEANEAYNNWVAGINGCKQYFADELADIVICVMTLSYAKDIDLEAAIQRKMAYNKNRG